MSTSTRRKRRTHPRAAKRPSVTQIREKLARDLDQPIEPTGPTVAELQECLNIASAQRDNALQQLTDRANIEIAFDRIADGIEKIGGLIRRLQTMQVELAQAGKVWAEQTAQIDKEAGR